MRVDGLDIYYISRSSVDLKEWRGKIFLGWLSLNDIRLLPKRYSLMFETNRFFGIFSYEEFPKKYIIISTVIEKILKIYDIHVTITLEIFFSIYNIINRGISLRGLFRGERFKTRQYIRIEYDKKSGERKVWIEQPKLTLEPCVFLLLY